MKFFICCLLTLSLFSCKKEYSGDISNIEDLIGTKINVPYEIQNSETPFDFADYYISFNLKFTKKVFDSLIENITIDKFEKIEYDDLGLKNKFQYYRENISEEQECFLAIDTTNNSFHYSSIR